MKTIYLIILILCSYCFAQEENDDFVQYFWAPISDTIATIKIPPHYKESHWKYGEGVKTELEYSDSAYILLHYGFNMSIPLLKSPEHLIYKEKKLKGKKYRYGRIQNTRLFWREDNLYSSVPVNIAYSKVTKAKLKLFNQSLDSFKLLKWNKE